MAQGEFTKQEAKLADECVNAIFNTVPKAKKMQLIGEFNDLLLFINAAKKRGAR